MKTLDEIIRASADRGDLNAVSILFSDGQWAVTYRGVADRDRRFVSHQDPVCALREALTGNPGDAPVKARRRRAEAAPKAVASFDDLLG